MVGKRQFNEGDDDGFRMFKRRQSFSLLHSGLRHLITERDPLNEKFFENFFRRLVREEVERVVPLSLHRLHPSPRPALHPAGTSGMSSMQLQFVQKFPSTIFTGTSVKAEDGTPIQIELIDAGSRTRVNSGPLSSIKIELVALKDDHFNDEENWTEQEFNASISREREGRRPLVTGDLTVTLREGVCHIVDISFTDNSSWMRTGKFRLGGRVVQKRCAGRIREARSDPFRVKDRRGEANQKHARLLLDDEVWRLKSIRKDGPHHMQLVAAGIMTVRDFLRTCTIDRTIVRNSLSRFSETRLETIIREAKTCYVDDGKLYTYHRAGGNGVALQFNSIYQVVAAKFDGYNYRSVGELTPFEKDAVEVLKKEAYKHVNDWDPVNELPTLNLSMPSASLSYQPFSVPEQDQLETWFGLNQFEASGAQSSHPIKRGNSIVREGFCNGDLPVFPSAFMTLYDNSLVQTPPYFPDTWEQGNDVYFASDVEVFSLPGVRTGKPRAAWCKIRAAVKLNSVRRVVAAKRFPYRL